MKIPACFLRSRKYDTRATRPHLLVHHLTDSVLHLLEQIQLLLVHTRVLHFHVTSVNSQLKTYGNLLRVTAPTHSSKGAVCRSWHKSMGDHQPINAAWIHFSIYRFVVHTAHILYCFPPIAPHWSLLVISEDSLEVCKFDILSFKSNWPKNGFFFLWTGYARSALASKFGS